jgi:hypothetical protein
MFTSAARAHLSTGVDAERREWLETLATACERVLARDVEDPSDPHLAALLEDVAELLSSIKAELRSSSFEF